MRNLLVALAAATARPSATTTCATRKAEVGATLGAGYYWADEQRREDVNYTGNSFTLTGDLEFGIAF